MEQEREDRFVILRFEVLSLKELSPSEKLVYARICGFKKYFESKEECSDVLGVSKDTVVKAKQKLVKLGFIKEIGNTGRGKIYQSVYDEEPRVVKSTNQSGKKAPIRVVKSTTIEEIENKERVKTITNVIGDAPVVYGKSEINDLFSYWKLHLGYEISSKQQMNRNACNNLLKKYGKKGVEQLIVAASVSNSEAYAPTISDFIELQSKLNKLLAWGRQKKQSSSKHISI